MKYSRSLPVVLLPLVLFALAAQSQVVQDTLSDPAAGVEVTADRLEYLQDQQLLIGIGNVVASQGLDILKADRITVHTETQNAQATGHVVLERAGQVWEGDELVYNFATRQGEFGEFSGYLEPFYINASEFHRLGDEQY
ncbi:MAG TPA: LptA/OstA family protein, partial [Kiritimatiellia bacterium]|nr:LptA/OstA family protein [Kiritimatiellia bacterium]